MEKKVDGVYDGFKELGTGKMIVLGLQHVFAMFGATVLVPILTGLSISVTLFCAGIGTIWFYFITKKKIPIFTILSIVTLKKTKIRTSKTAFLNCTISR